MDHGETNELEVEIERILPGGLGLAHAAGLTVLVSLSAPGDRLTVRIERIRGRVAFASIVEIQKPSPFRIEPPCPYFGHCGGCDFQQLHYEAQLQAKTEIIRDCLHRIARIESLPEVRVVASPKEWHYRSRANWQVDPEMKRVGYYERGTNVVCDVANCGVLVPELQHALERVRALLPDRLPPAVEQLVAVSGDTGVSVAPEVAGLQTRDVTRRIGPEDCQFSATTFFQINHDLLETLSAAAVADAQGNRAVDLYCGVGLFTLPLGRKFLEVLGIESSVDASRHARANLKNAGLGNTRIIASRVGEWLKRNAASVGSVDFLLLDPPRSGAERGVVQGILTLRPSRISYVSCDPATLARDLKSLLAGGYHLESIAAFDMFPQTHHVETVVHLRRERIPDRRLRLTARSPRRQNGQGK